MYDLRRTTTKVHWDQFKNRRATCHIRRRAKLTDEKGGVTCKLCLRKIVKDNPYV